MLARGFCSLKNPALLKALLAGYEYQCFKNTTQMAKCCHQTPLLHHPVIFFFFFFLLYSSFNAMYTAPFVLTTGVSPHLTRDAKRVIAGIPLHVPALGLQCTWSPGSTGTRRQPLGPKGSPTALQTPSHFEGQSLRRAKAFSSLSGKAPEGPKSWKGQLNRTRGR